MRSQNQFTELAAPYAREGETAFSKAMTEFVLHFAEELHLQVATVLDLACGSGEACVLFAQKGLSVIGVDLSMHMIEEARQKARDAQAEIQWQCQDMREFCVRNPVDLVTCMYDSLNFMTSVDDLEKTFCRVREALRYDGVFIFDMYTPRGLAELWGTRCEIHTNSDSFFIVSETKWDYDTQTNSKTLHGFSLKEERWHRWKEVHTLKAYPLNEVTDLLSKTGFNLTKTIDWKGEHNEPPTQCTQRVVVIAIKERRNVEKWAAMALHTEGSHSIVGAT